MTDYVTVTDCGECSWFDTCDWCHAMYGVCGNERTDHYQHVLAKQHKACSWCGKAIEFVLAKELENAV